MKKRFLALVICLIMAAGFCSAFAFAEETPKKNGEDYINSLIDLAEVLSYYHINADESDDPIRLVFAAMFEEDPGFFNELAEKMFQLYDGYSHYIPPSEYDLSYPKHNTYAGIGVELSDLETDRLLIKATIPGSPAEAAGGLPGDVIVEIGGKNVEALTYDAITPLLRGEPGTEVTVGFRRGDAPGILRFTIARAEIAVSNIYFEDMGSKIAYISVTRFGDEQTAKDFSDIYDNLGENGFESCIIDIRDNAGGDMDVLSEMLDHIYLRKDINMFAQKAFSFAETYRSSGKAVWAPKKLIVLTNEHTASAAEVFAGSLKENGLCTVVGAKTFGKGYAQVHIPMDDGSTAVVSVSEILLPVSLNYDKKGVLPDVPVEKKKVPYPMPKFDKFETKVLHMGDESVSVFALEQRLKELGYFQAAPDRVFDERTLSAVNALRRNENLGDVEYVTANTLLILENAISRLAATQVWEDTQLNKALELAAAS